MNTQTQLIRLDQIEVGDRLRAIGDDYVELLAASMADQGQISPIDVRPGDEPGTFRLIAGAHRYSAAYTLGWTEIEARVREADDLEAELLEIDENLMRRELSELDRATFLARRKEIHEQINPQAKHGGKRLKGQVRKFEDLSGRFSADVARRLNVSEQTIQRAIARFKKIAPDVRGLIAGSWLADHGAQLDALAKLDHAMQRKVAAELMRPQAAHSVAAALAYVRGDLPAAADVDGVQLRRLNEAWRKAGAKARAEHIRFLVVQGVVKLP